MPSRSTDSRAMPPTATPSLIAAAMAAPNPPMPAATEQDGSSQKPYRKRKNHRAGKKRRGKSFHVGGADDSRSRRGDEADEGDMADDPLRDTAPSASREDFYLAGRNLSSGSAESTNLLDHREPMPFLRARRPSLATTHQASKSLFAQQSPTTRTRPTMAAVESGDDDGLSENEGAPLLSQSQHRSSSRRDLPMYGTTDARESGRRNNSRPTSRRASSQSSGRNNSNTKSNLSTAFLSPFGLTPGDGGYNINYPPSVPGSPRSRPTDRLSHASLSFGDEMLREEMGASGPGGSAEPPLSPSQSQPSQPPLASSLPRSPPKLSLSGSSPFGTTVHPEAAADVCFPQDNLSEIAEDEHEERRDSRDPSPYRARPTRRRRVSKWPDLATLEEWSQFEAAHQSQARRAKKITEPQLVNGRLRPIHKGWHRAEEDAPYRFTYFNEEFQSTIHSQTISELVQPGASFRELFVPDPPLLSDSDSHSDAGGGEEGDGGEDGDGEEEDTMDEPAARLHRDSFSMTSQMLSPKRTRSTSRTAASPDKRGSVERLERLERLERKDGPFGGSPARSTPSGVLSPRTRTPDVVSDRGRIRAAEDAMAAAAAAATAAAAAMGTLAANGTAPVPGTGSGTGSGTGTATPAPAVQPVYTPTAQRTPRYGERPVWWLDILSPTEAEMRVLSKTFAIHPLTAEDIIMQEPREKVELFQHYYFVSYRSFDQDPQSETFLEPVNMYVVVFREGVLSFHFSMTPHPANVRRRIRQLRDYMLLSSDWVSYAIIDDITDVFVPLIQNIEDEVDDIDDAILQIHSGAEGTSSGGGGLVGGSGGGGAAGSSSGASEKDDPTPAQRAENDSDMLRRVGACRKRVMGLYRLLGNKADVIRGFAKRCNEHWEVAPRSEIGLYLGDIQDHIVTMTSNLSHYEKILSRSHGNYLAQINIRMNERQEQTADVLGKLTVLGTIVLPMNIITGLWGMNVWVPGQDYDGDLRWFVVITAGLIFFGLACYLIAKRVYQIV